MQRLLFGQIEARTANKGFSIAWVQCSSDIFVINQRFVLRINIFG